MSQKTQGGGVDSMVTPFRDVNADSAQRRIADDLRQARLARGVEIAEVARTLRIRAVYLAALEEGRFADLPGPTYVAGFLRGYGRYLDLDGDELVRRFKDESGGAIARPTLNFPVPASEARHPRGLMIAAALVIALAAAGGWYALQERDRAALELVPAVPDELAPAAGEVEAVAEAAEQELAADEAAETAAIETTGGAKGDSAAAAGASEPEAAAAAEPDADGATVEGADGTSAAGLAATVAAEAGDEAVADGYVPRIYGRTNGDSRVEVRAIAETWIQVEGAGNEVLLTRVLLPGDIYHVPDRADVTLDTGNAGGLEIRVDGALLEPLGAPGIVIRNISLAPDDLLAR